MTTQTFVVTPDEVDTMMAEWVTAKILSTPGLTGVKNMSAVSLFFEPGQGHARHNHAESEQFIFVISGSGTQMVETEPGRPMKQNISAGCLVCIPRGAYHETFNTGWEPMRLLAIYSPCGPETFMRDSAEFRVLPAGEIPVRP